MTARGKCTDAFVLGWRGLSRRRQETVNEAVSGIREDPYLDAAWREAFEAESPFYPLRMDTSAEDLDVVYEILDSGKEVNLMYLLVAEHPARQRPGGNHRRRTQVRDWLDKKAKRVATRFRTPASARDMEPSES